MVSKTVGVALIIPALNEEGVVGETVRRIPAGIFNVVVVADNGSVDRTSEEAREAGAMVVRVEERGYGAACLAAMAALPDAIEIVVFLQADGSEDAGEATKLIAPLLDGRADMVLGSRTIGEAEKGSLLPHQVFGNWLATTLMRLFWGKRYTDLGPFRAVRLDVLRRMGMRDRNYGWTVEMQVKAARMGLRVLEVPVRYGLRRAGENKVSGNWKASARAGWKILWVIGRELIAG
jgi:glycosyltransferase involved in cell wall biosynthesis